MRGPLVGRGVDAVKHARRGLARLRQRSNGCQLAHVQILARAPEVALNTAFHKGDQAVFHVRTLGRWQHKALVHALRQGRQIDQVRRQRIAAAIHSTIRRWEVVGQTVAVQIVGQLRHGASPQLGVVHANGLAGGLLQAGVGIAGPPVTHAWQTFGQLGHQRHLQATTAGQRISGRVHGHGVCAVHLHQRGLLHRQWHGGHDALADFQGILRSVGTTAGVTRGDLPDQCFGTRA